jgi:hypothetical protein
LLGFLVEVMGADRVRAFTYHHGEVVGDMDRDLAVELATIAKVEHKVLPAYRGDFVSLLDFNSERGEGVAHFCEEGDVWRALDPEFEQAANWVLAVGERHVGIKWGRDWVSPEGALAVCSVWSTATIEWWLDQVPASTGEAMREGWDAVYQKVVSRVRSSGSQECARESWHPRAYFQERIGVTLALWRELFCGHSIRVISPYLDGRLLDFVARLPFELNNAERGLLHRDAIAAAFPSLTPVGLSRGGWNMPSWHLEIQRNSDRLKALIRSSESPLDELISPDALLKLLNAIEVGSQPLAEATRGFGWSIRKVVKQSPPALREWIRDARRYRRTRPQPVDPARLLRRLLCLRMALTKLAERRTSQPAGPATYVG